MKTSLTFFPWIIMFLLILILTHTQIQYVRTAAKLNHSQLRVLQQDLKIHNLEKRIDDKTFGKPISKQHLKEAIYGRYDSQYLPEDHEKNTIEANQKFIEGVRDALTKEHKYAIDVEATAYCPGACCCGNYADGFTATGENAYGRGVAVDPKVIPLGSMLYIPGYGYAIADDVGGAIKGEKIDVRFRTHEEARQWGRQRKTITVFRK